MSETDDRNRGAAHGANDTPDIVGADDLADLRELRAMRPSGATLTAVEWQQPPADLWQRIAADAGVDADSGSTHDSGGTHDSGDPGHSEVVVSLADRRRRRWTVPFTIAAAVVLIGVVTTVIVTRGDGTDQVVAAVQLDRLAGAGSGSAEMVNHDGHMQLHLHTDGLDAGDGYVEVWLIDPTVSKMVSLGPLTDDGVFDVPTSVDPTQFPIVDVSAEPVDGNPAHSGASLLRGQLDFGV